MNIEDTQKKTEYQAELFSNRLKKKYKELRKWARKSRVSCYRLYDRDIPEIPVSLDLYEFLPDGVDSVIEAARLMSDQNARLSANDPAVEHEIKERTYAVLYLYERPYEKSDEDEAAWLDAMSAAASEVLGIELSHIVKKSRGHKSHKDDEQYQKNDSVQTVSGIVQEQGQLFRLDLTSYLDTGLFFDHRPLRSVVRDTCSKERVLNLFCYTGSFSVYSAQGNASFVESVDLSNTYLSWAKDNMKLNGFTDKKRYEFTRADCMRFLQEKAVNAKGGKLSPEELYDLIILDPPTFSNSKATTDVLDINRDWPQLVKDCLNILAPGGSLYFSTNSERIKFDISKIPPKTAAGSEFTWKEITEQTIPVDFAGKKPHKVWEFILK
ncbi:23S rRNA (cytosine1962-C5)-methyltransferase [Treponema bryantii]|uniref:23S rRNA (Cytosine1962-C5)-methyltransferase n=1 Tax=Treponema bryantii TaxID=163 RepID=A0A1I3K9K7_9SPIR|nr:class I SAM-dependent methyltransferase [Treponema bryantii]SFI69147.1 23S rRNA (cytosine1962-C5)-methyltransferase [Treponema bryantii]